jgi:hypothetical protein
MMDKSAICSRYERWIEESDVKRWERTVKTKEMGCGPSGTQAQLEPIDVGIQATLFTPRITTRQKLAFRIGSYVLNHLLPDLKDCSPLFSYKLYAEELLNQNELELGPSSQALEPKSETEPQTEPHMEEDEFMDFESIRDHTNFHPGLEDGSMSPAQTLWSNLVVMHPPTLSPTSTHLTNLKLEDILQEQESKSNPDVNILEFGGFFDGTDLGAEVTVGSQMITSRLDQQHVNSPETRTDLEENMAYLNESFSGGQVDADMLEFLERTWETDSEFFGSAPNPDLDILFSQL